MQNNQASEVRKFYCACLLDVIFFLLTSYNGSLRTVVDSRILISLFTDHSRARREQDNAGTSTSISTDIKHHKHKNKH